MKHLKLLALGLIMTLVISACGAQPVPTMDPADVQLTTVAEALTILAEAQPPSPTLTPVSPTESPSPTPLPPTASQTPVLLTTLTTLPTLPTLQLTSAQVSSTTAPVSNPGPDPCLSPTKRIPFSPAGRATTIRIINSNRTTVNVSVYLNKTPHGECGYRSYIINSQSEITITNLVQGCYNLWAWSNDASTPVKAASKISCINSPDKWTFQITATKIKFLDL